MSAPRPPDPAGEPPTERAVLAVAGMHCASCAALIEESLVERAGVLGAHVDLTTERAVIDFDPVQVDVGALCAIVAETGDYRASTSAEHGP
ncbi:MAG: cation transporter [Acidimicrobiales bacterium]